MNSKEQGPFAKSSDFDNWVKAVWQVVDGIPRGHVLTYGEVARLAGMSRAARRVSLAMRRAPRGMKLPWHRVIQSSGRIAFEKGSRAYNRQSRRLIMEDVVILEGRIDMQKYRWQPDLDELLWKPSAMWDGSEP